MAGIPKLLFIDANILLDFYRARTDAALSLLKHLETISHKIIVTYQLEMEFKKISRMRFSKV
jgi:predicted nucleic acid-binding protein